MFLPDNVPIMPPAPLKPIKKERTIGDMSAIIEAQKLYAPNAPQPPKGPPAAIAESGAAGKSDMSGSWGKPSG